ncbi:MAG: pyridoxal phosphate-dependent aminotransferase [Betaproteobacteria bacterium]|nr:pyridoxal phosphate-dependent aminotransferase [Betaproteobacteria bacterium]
MHIHSRDGNLRHSIVSAARAAQIQPFLVMEVLARANELERTGRRIVRMEIGEPDFTAPDPVVRAAARAMRDGLTGYTAALGITELREAIAAFYQNRYRIDISPSRIAVTAGASGALLLTLAALIDPGDEVLVPDPGYPCYRHFVRAFEGVARAVPVAAKADFQPTLSQVEAAWGPRTKALILGSPSNPAGTLIQPEELAHIARFVDARGGVLIVDEIYQGLVYTDSVFSALGLPGNIVVINSFSKYFCMTGWRLGWAVLPESMVRAFEKLAQHFFICPPTLSQRAALAAFLPESIEVLEQRREEFRRRRNFLVPALQTIGFDIPAHPSGAFYVFADCSAFHFDAKRFAFEVLLERAGVATTPGNDFGANDTQRFVRFAYTRSMEELAEGVDRIQRACTA